MWALPVTVVASAGYRPHAGFVVSEWFKPGLGPTLVESAGIFDRMRPERLPGESELGAVELRLPGIDPHSVFQVGQVRCGSLPPGDCCAQGLQEGALLDRVVVRVLGEQPGRLGCLSLTNVRPGHPRLASRSASQRVLS
jgi:hypothetical protein